LHLLTVKNPWISQLGLDYFLHIHFKKMILILLANVSLLVVGLDFNQMNVVGITQNDFHFILMMAPEDVAMEKHLMLKT
jgi:hypothetical protein